MDYQADPRRIVYRKGLHMPAKCIYAARPSPWGNPYSVKQYNRFGALNLFARFAIERLQNWDVNKTWLDPIINAEQAACWCKLHEPCHVDLLFAFADLINVHRQLHDASIKDGFDGATLKNSAARHREMYWSETSLAIMTHDQCIAQLPEQPDQSTLDLALATIDDKRIDLQTSIVLMNNIRRRVAQILRLSRSILNSRPQGD